MSTKKVKPWFVCGPVPGGRGYLDWCEHAEQKRKRKACEPECFFCEADRHPELYECVNGEWRDSDCQRCADLAQAVKELDTIIDALKHTLDTVRDEEARYYEQKSAQQAEEIARLADRLVECRASVQEMVKAAVAAERERCYKIACSFIPLIGSTVDTRLIHRASDAQDIAAALRAAGEPALRAPGPMSEPEANPTATPHITTRADIETVDALRRRVRDLEVERDG